jgi:hypothetical protein
VIGDEVRSMIGYAQGPHGGTDVTRTVVLLAAQAEATLLLAEEQRTANLLTLATSGRCPINVEPRDLMVEAARRMGVLP